jgi:hypothetical protein
LFESNGVRGVLPPHAFFSLLTDDTTAVHGEHIPWTAMIKGKKSGDALLHVNTNFWGR